MQGTTMAGERFFQDLVASFKVEASSTSRLLSIPSGSNKLLEKVLSSILNVASTAVCILWCTFLGQALQWDVKRSLHPTGSLRILGLDHFPQLLLK